MKTFFAKAVCNACFVGLALSALTFASCTNDSDDDEEEVCATTEVSLPASSGTDELSGTTWEFTESDGYACSWTFDNGKAVRTQSNTEDGSTAYEISTYSYTFDSENKLLHLGLAKVEWKGGDISGTFRTASEWKKMVSQYLNEHKKEIEADGWTYTDAQLDKEYSDKEKEFSTKLVYKYEMDGSSLKLSEYFDGALPTLLFFDNSDWNSNVHIQMQYGNFGFFNKNEDGDDYYVCPTFSNGTFTGAMYKSTNGEYSAIGNASGVYTTTGTGVRDCVITISFTSLPEGISNIAVNTVYTLDDQESDSKTFTKK